MGIFGPEHDGSGEILNVVGQQQTKGRQESRVFRNQDPRDGKIPGQL